jgi:hypothetical protein
MINNSNENLIEPGYCGQATATRNPKPIDVLKTKVKDSLRPIYRHFKHFFIAAICSMRKDYQGIIYVDPLEIKRTVNKSDRTLKRNDMWHFGTVEGGDWDKNGIPIKEYGLIYPILKQRIKQNKAYDEIIEFNENLERIANGEKPDLCSSERQYREKWQRIETLFKLIEEKGYQSQKVLKTGYPFNEIRIQIGRNGDLLFEEGMHRLVICQLLGFKRIPVIVTRRHSEWVGKHKDKIYKNYHKS